MIKKSKTLVAILLSMTVITLFCCGCGNMENGNGNGSGNGNTNERADSSSNMIEDAGEVLVTLPAAMFESIDAAKEEVKQILSQEGVKSAETAEDGSVRVVMTKEGHQKALENYKKSMIYEYVTGKKEVPHS